MAKETVSEGFGYEDMGTVLWVPTIANPSAPTLAELTAGTPITYDLYGASGYSLAVTETPRNITRYTLAQQLSAEGTIAYALTLLYVFNRETPTDAETTIGVRGTSGYIVHFLGYENGWTRAAGDVITDLVPVRTTRSHVVPATANTEAHKMTSPSITGEVLHEIAIVAA
ncbi:hypothetical protein [Microbacterium sp. LWH12-1.2]|uniref:phage tail tube protein n=1 Tax=Microbacterium sp. LWH12-1.2 TaxID=3135259 RepID=UPI003428B667